MKLKQYLNEQETDKKIFLDMDGVIVDFVGAIDKIHGIKDFREWEKIGREKYELINKMGEKWWSQMKWLGDGKKLWNYLKDSDVTILSATPQDPESRKISIQGKKNWLKKNIGSSYASNALIVLAVEKQMQAAPNHILIDDSDRNIAQWRNQGGIGILHKNTNDTIKQLERLNEEREMVRWEQAYYDMQDKLAKKSKVFAKILKFERQGINNIGITNDPKSLTRNAMIIYNSKMFKTIKEFEEDLLNTKFYDKALKNK